MQNDNYNYDFNTYQSEETPIESTAEETTSFDQFQPVKPKRSIKKTIIAAISAVLSIAVIVGGVLLIVRNSDPLNMVSNAAVKTFAGMVGEANDVIDGGSVELSIGLDTFARLDGAESVDGNASFKMYFDNTSEAALVAAIDLNDAAALDVTAVFDDTRIAVRSDVLLGDDAYGITFAEIAENLEDSAFGPGGAYDLGFDMDEVEQLVETIAKNKSSSAASVRIMHDFFTELKKSIKAHAEIEKGKDTLAFGDDDCKTTTVTVTLDSVGVYNVIHDILVYLNEDKAVKKYLEANEEMLAVYVDYYGEDFVEDFYENIEDLLDEMEEAEDEGYFEDADVEFEFNFYISKSGKYLVGVSFDGDIEGDELKFELFAGPSPKKLNEITFKMDDGYSTAKASFEVEVNDKNEYYASFEIKEDGYTFFEGEIEWDKKGGDFALTMGPEDEMITLEGELVEEKDGAVLTVETLDDGYDSYDLDITVAVSYSDKMPEISEYTDLLTMDEDEIEDLALEISEAVQSLG